MGCLCCTESESDDESLLGDGPSGQSQVSYGSTKSEVHVTLRVGSVKDICGLNSNKFLIQNGTHYVEVKSLKMRCLPLVIGSLYETHVSMEITIWHNIVKKLQ